MFSTLRVLVQIAFRNLFASRLKTAIVGGIVFFGALLVTVGGSLLGSVTGGMARSITGTLAGDVQVYGASSKDDLAIFGGFGDQNLAQIDSFETLKAVVEKVPNVARVVPMGISGALVTSGNTIDLVLEKLRNAVRKETQGDRSPALLAEIEAQKEHVRQMVQVLEGEQKNLVALVDATKLTQEDRDNAMALARAASPQFWADFDRDPLNALEFLENKIAPQSTDADMLMLRYVGTDLSAFGRSFDRFRIVDGKPVPPGKRGFLFAKYFYEDRIKLRTARRLDKIREALSVKGQTIASDPDLQRMVHENERQTREILLQLDPTSTRNMTKLLRDELGSKETDLGKLLASFFAMDDASFERRYHFFYDRLAPMLELYRIRVGDTLTIKAFTKTGYSRSINLKVYGTFEFQGLEKSPLAGSVNLMDLVSFRDLYGFLTPDNQKEVARIEQAAGERAIDRAHADDELFGGDSKADAAQAPPAPPPMPKEAMPAVSAPLEKLHRDDRAARDYDPAELEKGVVLDAAVVLRDHSKVDQAIRDIGAATKRAGLDVKAVSWQDAAGIIGKLVMTFRLVLYLAFLVIFLVALVIINNALVMATLERVREIGTLRAVGAQKTFVLGMLVVEAATLGGVFGGLGAGVGALVVALLGAQGIPATSDVMNFFFSGPRLYPSLAPATVALAIAIVLVVATLSSFYPAWLAMRVSPREAMASDE